MPKIIIVDDDPNALRQAEEILKAEGFEVISFDYPKPILKIIKAEQPDLIISDIIMPGLDGYALCKEVKEVYRNKIAVILCTAKSYEQELIERAHKEFGADDFIFKPFKKEELVQKVRQVIKKRQEASKAAPLT